MLVIEELNYDWLFPPWVPNPPRPRARPDQWYPYWYAIACHQGLRKEDLYDCFNHEMPEGMQ